MLSFFKLFIFVFEPCWSLFFLAYICLNLFGVISLAVEYLLLWVLLSIKGEGDLFLLLLLLIFDLFWIDLLSILTVFIWVLFIPIIFILVFSIFPFSVNNKLTEGTDFPISIVFKIGSSLVLNENIFLIFKFPVICILSIVLNVCVLKYCCINEFKSTIKLVHIYIG